MKHAFITGTSRGIGLSLAKAMCESDQYKVTGISRNQDLEHNNYKHLNIDLSDPSAIPEELFEPVDTNASLITLVNNAGAIGQVGRIGKLGDSVVSPTFNVNLISPILLTNRFLDAYRTHPATKVIIQISSGAGKRPVDGWSIYCATKAGLDMFNKTLVEELALTGDSGNIFAFSIAPGTVDTEMQAEIRKADDNASSTKSYFVGLKKNGGLVSPDSVAEKLVQVIEHPNSFTETEFRLFPKK